MVITKITLGTLASNSSVSLAVQNVDSSQQSAGAASYSSSAKDTLRVSLAESSSARAVLYAVSSSSACLDLAFAFLLVRLVHLVFLEIRRALFFRDALVISRVLHAYSIPISESSAAPSLASSSESLYWLCSLSLMLSSP